MPADSAALPRPLFLGGKSAERIYSKKEVCVEDTPVDPRLSCNVRPNRHRGCYCS